MAEGKAKAMPKAEAHASAEPPPPPRRRPAAAVPPRRRPAAARCDVEADAEAARMAFDPDPIDRYLDVDAIGADLPVIQNRLHSFVWHSAMKFHTNAGLTKEQAKPKASEQAALHVDRWREKVGLPPIGR
ncbi:unnamed protein product [Prorocentrum cordatum]|uniref:Uncharacterized protein n=1 Tax=Prorocentrum cordatum TaxID=2364126 RepID=A0ABN9VQN0_9DINO|nr:unnamed protein product [Polarella glacialis]